MAAFGPSTPLLQQAILTLLQGRQPSPLAPVPTMPMTPPGGVFQMPLGPPPEPAPVAPPPALDQSLIEQLTGPRPVAPVAQPVSLLQKVALALQGFGAGTQGQGPQFLANLQEQRERPQREFRAATEQYEANRRRAIGIAEEKRQGEQADIQRRADIQSGRQFQLYEGELRDRRQEARDLRLQAKQLEIEDRRAKAEQAELDRKDKAAKEKQRNDIAADLIKNPNLAPQKVANEIADAIVYGKPMSPATEKWRSIQLERAQAQIDRLARIGKGGGESSGPVMAQLEDGTVVPLTSVNRDTGRVILGGKPLKVVGYVGGRIPAQSKPAPAAPPARSLTDQFINPSYVESLMAPAQQPTQALTKPQQSRFNDIKAERPDLSDEQVKTYMRSKGWLQ